MILSEGGFLQIPDIDYINRKPSDPYNYPNQGLIHTSKFNEIYQFLLSDRLKSEFFQKFRGHRIYTIIKGLNKDDLADFSRHLIILNKNKLGWQKADELISQLDKKYIPKWDLPDLRFEKGFKEIFSSIIPWKMEQKLKQKTIHFLKNYNISFIDNEEIFDKLSSNYMYWSIRDLWIIYEGIINLVPSSERTKHYTELLDFIEEIFLNHINNQNYSIYYQMAITALYVQTNAKKSVDALYESHDLLDKMWREIQKREKEEIASFKYLFGACYSFLAYEYFTSNIDYIVRRDLLGKIISDFINPDKMEIEKWFEYLISSNIHPLLIDFLLNGYLTAIKILEIHILELPPSTISKKLIKMYKSIIQIVFSTTKKYIFQIADIESLEEVSGNSFIKKIDMSNIDGKAIFGLKSTLVNSYILYILNFEENTPPDLLKYYKTHYLPLIKAIEGNKIAKLNQYFIEMILGTYPIQEYYERIENEISNEYSVIGSTTFEEEIIRFISHVMEVLMDRYIQSGRIEIESYEKLAVFVSNWLQYFKMKQENYQDVLLILAPIISICFVQISRGHYENQSQEKSLLSFLNMHYFVYLFMEEVELSSQKQSMMMNSKSISSEFTSMMEEWDLSNFFNISAIRKRIIDLQISFSDRISDTRDNFSGMIEDEIIIGYSDLATDIEKLIIDNISNEKTESIVDQIKKSSVYKEETTFNMNILNRIGKIADLDKRYLPFPIIQNVHNYAIALQLFPLSSSFQEDLIDNDLYNSFNDIISFKE